MGEVYRARDTRLGRDVAVKVLPPGLLGRTQARDRFRREALALARLSHPHIATLLDFDTAEGIDFLVMELVEGKPLLDAVREGPLDEKEVVRLGSQLTRGLASAHERGVIHRDLKLANLALTPDGLLKVLDFGLARLQRLAQPAVEEQTAATETAAGSVVGTPAYMAPEQLRGKEVDARTDIYGAGACLYELATGRRPFGTKSGVELMDAVLREAPVPPRSVNGAVSPGLEAVILKALDKDPRLRYQTAKELQVDLERLQVATASGTASQPEAVTTPRRRHRPWLVAAAAVSLLAMGGVWLARPLPSPHVTNIWPLTRGLPAGNPNYETLTTDGPRIYYTALVEGDWGLYQIPANGGEPNHIPLPFKGPVLLVGYSQAESTLIIGAELTPSGGPLWTVPVTGGAPRRVGDLLTPAALSTDGQRLAAIDRTTHQLVISNVDGTVRSKVAALPPGSDNLRWEPQGGRLRFDAGGPQGHEAERWTWEVSVGGGTLRPLFQGNGGGWTPDGRYFVFRSSDLYAVREGMPWLHSHSPPARLTFGPHIFSVVTPSFDGHRLLAIGTEPGAQLVRWVSSRKRFEPVLGGGSIGMVDASRDGQWLTWVSFPEGALWRGRRDGSERLQLTGGSTWAFLPRWSPDGTRIVFAGAAEGDTGLSIRIVSVNGDGERIVAKPTEAKHSYWDPCWLPDGRTVLFSNLADFRPPGIHRVDVETLRRDLLPGSEDLQYPKCAREGQVLATRVRRPGEPVVAGGLGSAVLWPGRNAWEPIGNLPFAYANWSRDGRSVYGLNLEAKRVQRFELAGRKVEDVADVTMPLAIWMYVPWFGIDFDDAPLLMADRGTHEIYALDWEAP